MGKTVQIDDDVMRAAERLAAERGTTPDEIVSELARRELTRPPSGPLIERNGFYVLPSRGGVVTSALVKRLAEEADLEDAGLRPKD
ncbi:MAG: CopG family transcriptional regulator [Xanthobacteraceae bacterium]